MTTIDKDIPIPPRSRAVERWPYSKLEIGNSFMVSNEGLPYRRFKTTTSRAGKRLGFKFTTRQVDGGYRVWRTE